MTPKELYDKYALESYQNSYDHGFWENKENRNKDEMIMLMINELSECQEAYRSSKHDTSTYEAPTSHGSMETLEQSYANWYKVYIKGCTGEELADVVIRVFDYVYGWNYIFDDGGYIKIQLSDNFSQDLLRLTRLISAYGPYWPGVIQVVIMFAERWNIDLDWHIAHKQRFNRTRPYKHGNLF